MPSSCPQLEPVVAPIASAAKGKAPALPPKGGIPLASSPELLRLAIIMASAIAACSCAGLVIVTIAGQWATAEAWTRVAPLANTLREILLMTVVALLGLIGRSQ